jgi:hypothetical protein
MWALALAMFTGVAVNSFAQGSTDSGKKTGKKAKKGKKSTGGTKST